MKKVILTFLLSSILTGSFSQELSYEVRGKYDRPVKKEAIAEAHVLSDFIEGYPINWVKDYISVEVLTNENGNTLKASGQNETLNIEQKKILNNLDLSTDVKISVWYKSANPATEKIENRNMVVKMTVIPQVEAEFVGGYKQLKQYLKVQLDQMTENTPKEFQNGKVGFTINEQGEVINAEIDVSSGNTKTDDLLLEIITKMPIWEPAKNTKGENVKQRFIFSMGIGGC